ncbi:MAG: DNA-binding protein [Candidatus Cryptobacteroides sp.]|nr:DNA-binding protein [Bacteroidales bacterium]MDY5743901.1 DNA-binding protein [Candidatus Cryptobacteroides sp.]
MKLKNLFLALAAFAATAVSCVKAELAQLDEIQVSQSYIALPVEGGSCDVTVTATGSWEITDIPEWLTVAPASGVAGKTVVTFSAEATSATNESVLKLLCAGKTQLLTVLQMADKVELPITSCAEVNAAEDGITFKIKGTITAIENTTYGNLYVTDETGSVYIYGTLYEGATKQFSKYGVEVGDIVVVEGPRGNYKGSPQLVNATILEIEKSLIKVDSVDPETAELPLEGGILTITLTAKGDGVDVVIPEENKSWISVSGMKVSGTSAVVSFNIAENAGGDRSSELSFKTTKGGKTYTAVTSFSQKGAIIEATAAEINAAVDGDTQYRITGYVSKVANTKYGNLYIKDYSGEVFVYGTNDFATSGIEEGDIITVVGPKTTSPSSAPQMKNVTLEKRIDVQDIDLAGFKALEDNKEAWYRISGTVAKSTEDNTKWDLETYGNFALTDGTTEVYVYGVVPGWGGTKGQFGTLGVKEGDKLTIVCHKASYTKNDYTLHQAGSAFYVSHETPADPEAPLGTYASNVKYTLGANAYDDGVATVNGTENVATIKLGSSKNIGTATVTLPKGTTSVSFYAVAWNGKTATLQFSIGGTVIGTQAVVGNAGVTGSAPYTLTVADTDKYSLTMAALEADTEVTVTTVEAVRVILFGIQAK